MNKKVFNILAEMSFVRDSDNRFKIGIYFIRACTIKLFTLVINTETKLARTLVPASFILVYYLQVSYP
jgi:hypothetical protein